MIKRKYRIIYADPPWPFEKGWLWERTRSRADSHYPTLTIEEICSLPIGGIAHENAHLYLWTTSRDLMLGRAAKVCESWGFRPINVLTRCKPQISLGYYFRNDTEHLLFGVRGSMRTLDRRQGTHFIHDRLKHSQKPPVVREWIVKWSGDLPRIELFARKPQLLFEDESFEGWDVWGDEVESSIELS